MRCASARKWKSDSQPLACGSRRRRRRCCASTATYCMARAARRSNRRLSPSWFHPLPEESPQWASQHRAEAERQSTRTVRPESGDLAQGEQASQRLGPAGSPGESAQWPLPVLRAAAVLHVAKRRPSAGSMAVVASTAAPESEGQTWHLDDELSRQTVVPTSKAASGTRMGLTHPLNCAVDLFWGA